MTRVRFFVKFCYDDVDGVLTNANNDEMFFTHKLRVFDDLRCRRKIRLDRSTYKKPKWLKDKNALTNENMFSNRIYAEANLQIG